MNISKTTIGLGIVVTCAFVAGRLSTFHDSISVAHAQESKKHHDHDHDHHHGHDHGHDHAHDHDHQLPPEMLAWKKAGKPGQNHKYLNHLVGTWDAHWTFKMNADAPFMEAGGTIKREWIFDNRYVKEIVVADMPDGTFEGVGYIGYNNVDGLYEVAWLDSYSTGILFETGSFDPSTKILSLRGAMRDPVTGQTLAKRATLDMSNPNRHVFTGFMTGPDGREFKSAEGIAERQR